VLLLNIIPSSVRKYFQKILYLIVVKPRELISFATILLFKGTSLENFHTPSIPEIFLKKRYGFEGMGK